ncbi:MAG: hypothetical protein II794_03220 [Oscillospiraceae bacterium]|nr:hypothetical protein [Oscillospiraceae bacterium]
MTGRDIFEGAMALIDRYDRENQEAWAEDFSARAPGIINSLMAEERILRGAYGQAAEISGLDDEVEDTPEEYCLGPMEFALASELLREAWPEEAESLEKRAREMKERYADEWARQRDMSSAEEEEIRDLYGTGELGQFGRW